MTDPIPYTQTLDEIRSEIIEPEAHAPTDTERGALIKLLEVADEAIQTAADMADALLAAGFRRSEVPEPGAKGYAEFEGWEQEMFRHQPVLSMADGSIAGCQCLDRVFMKGREDWGTHLASIIAARLEPQGEPSDAPKVVTLDDVYAVTGLKTLVSEARSEGDWCCVAGCGNGACETCPCCCTGWCVSGVDGVPENIEDRERWLEVAAEHNPIAAALRAAGGAPGHGTARPALPPSKHLPEAPEREGGVLSVGAHEERHDVADVEVDEVGADVLSHARPMRSDAQHAQNGESRG